MTRTKARDVAKADHHHGNGKLERSDVVEAIDAWMREQCPGDGVDALLTHPIDAALMALQIASLHTGVPIGQIQAAADGLNALRDQHSGAFAAVDGICRIAMNARKQGKLKPHSPSPGTKAAATRKMSERAEGRAVK